MFLTGWGSGPRGARSGQEQTGAARSSLEQPHQGEDHSGATSQEQLMGRWNGEEAYKRPTGCGPAAGKPKSRQEQPGAARCSQEQPRAAKSNSELPIAARRLGAARTSQEPQETPGKNTQKQVRQTWYKLEAGGLRFSAASTNPEQIQDKLEAGSLRLLAAGWVANPVQIRDKLEAGGLRLLAAGCMGAGGWPGAAKRDREQP